MIVFIDTMEDGKEYTSEFGVLASMVKTAKNNKQYLDMSLTDGKKVIFAKAWEFQGEAPSEGSTIITKYKVSTFQETKQITICYDDVHGHNIMPSKKNIQLNAKLIEEFKKFFLRELEEEADLLEKFFSSEEFRLFIKCPGGAKHHHNYEGGLMAHTLEVAQWALKLSDDSNRFSLVLGSLFHDLGKIYEYKIEGTSIIVTVEGFQIGHIVKSYEMFKEVFPNKYKEVQHMILAHHGKKEWGSPVEPATTEAYLLHTADMLSAGIDKLRKS